MNDSTCVRGLERFNDLPGDGKCFIEWHRPEGQPIGERAPLD
jgi:hypothetical protein